MSTSASWSRHYELPQFQLENYDSAPVIESWSTGGWQELILDIPERRRRQQWLRQEFNYRGEEYMYDGKPKLKVSWGSP